jgi:hypothetical protein
MSEYFSNGILEYNLTMSNTASDMIPARCVFEIIAKDEFGNTDTRRMELVNSRISDIVRVEIYADGKPVPRWFIAEQKQNKRGPSACGRYRIGPVR